MTEDVQSRPAVLESDQHRHVCLHHKCCMMPATLESMHPKRASRCHDVVVQACRNSRREGRGPLVLTDRAETVHIRDAHARSQAMWNRQHPRRR
jgi:hypothetical protein